MSIINNSFSIKKKRFFLTSIRLLTALLKCKKDVSKNIVELKNNVGAFIKICTPDTSKWGSQILNSVRITIFWKVIATLRLSNKFVFPNLECILHNALDDYVRNELEKNDNKFLKQYVTGLTLVGEIILLNDINKII